MEEIPKDIEKNFAGMYEAGADAYKPKHENQSDENKNFHHLTEFMKDAKEVPLNPDNWKRKPRLTVVETVYYEQVDQSATSVESKFATELMSDEQPVCRKMTIGPAWEKLHSGWLNQASLVLIINKDKLELLFVSVAKEPDEVQWIISPGRSFRGEPKDLSQIWLSGANVKCEINIFPV